MAKIMTDAKQYAKLFRYPILLTLLYIGLYISFRDLFAELLGAMGLIVLLLGMSLEHGKVKLGLDLIHLNKVVPQTEAAVGIKNIRQLFSTYLWMNLMIFGIVCLGLVGVMLVARPYFLVLLEVIQSELTYGIQTTLTQMTSGGLFIASMLAIVGEFIVNVFFFTAPYLCEMENIKGIRCLKRAYQLTKNHRKETCQLFSHYLMYIIVFVCLNYLASYYISSTFMYSLVDIVLTMVSIFVYEGEYVIVRALYFEKLRGEEKNDASTNI